MWKFVTRRVKDTVERTYNVLDKRFTWPCSSESTNDKDSSAGQRINNKSPNVCIWYRVKDTQYGYSSSSRHEDRRYDYAYWNINKQLIDAFVFVSIDSNKLVRIRVY